MHCTDSYLAYRRHSHKNNHLRHSLIGHQTTQLMQHPQPTHRLAHWSSGTCSLNQYTSVFDGAERLDHQPAMNGRRLSNCKVVNCTTQMHGFCSRLFHLCQNECSQQSLFCGQVTHVSMYCCRPKHRIHTHASTSFVGKLASCGSYSD